MACVLVAGGAGFLGTHLTEHLASLGHDVFVLDNLSGPASAANLEWLESRLGPSSRSTASISRAITTGSPGWST